MDTSSGPRIVVVGSANIDFIMKMDRLPREGESVTNAVFNQAFGGKGANQAVAAARSTAGARAGAPVPGMVSMIASLGHDQFADEMIEGWAGSGLDTGNVSRAEGPTGCALIMIDKDGSNLISAAPSANDQLLPARIDELKPVIGGAGYVLIQFEVPESTTERVLDVATAAGVPVVWNVAPMRAVRPDLVGRASIVVVNETEAESITGIPVTDTASARAAAGALLALGPSAAIVTLGEAGSMMVSDRGAGQVPAFPVVAVDTTAAGDTYCGCLVTALTEGKSLTEAVSFASAGAALSVQRLGAQPSVPWRNEIDEFLGRSRAAGSDAFSGG